MIAPFLRSSIGHGENEVELAASPSLDSAAICAKIRVVSVAVMEVRMLPPGQKCRDD
jgi:hypothetical protein